MCLKCPKGQYMDLPTQWTGSTEDTLCHVCPIGKFEPKEGATKCQACPTGRTTQSFMETFRERCSLKTCPAGQFMKKVFTQEDCYFCPAGKFLPFPSRHLKCKECPKGKYNAHLALASCRACAVGRFSMSRGSAKCGKCKAGKTSDLSNTACVAQQARQPPRSRATNAGAGGTRGYKEGASVAAQPKEFCSCEPGVSPRSSRTRCAATRHASASDRGGARRLVADDVVVRVEHTQPMARRLLSANAAFVHQGGKSLPLTHVCKVVQGQCHCCECNDSPQDSITDEAAAWMAAFHQRGKA